MLITGAFSKKYAGTVLVAAGSEEDLAGSSYVFLDSLG